MRRKILFYHLIITGSFLFACLAKCAAEAANSDNIRDCTANRIVQDSGVFQIQKTDLPNTIYFMPPAKSLLVHRAIEHYISRRTQFGKDCDVHTDLQLGEAIHMQHRQKVFADVYYLESKLGYFIVHEDYFEVYNVVFVRWD